MTLPCSLVRERGQNLRSCAMHMVEALRENLGIAVPELDIVRSCRIRFETNCVADNESCGFRFCFAHALIRCVPPVALVEKFVRNFMSQCRKLFGGHLPGQQPDASA